MKLRVQSKLLPYIGYMRRPCQQMATRLLSFIKFEPLVDHGKSSADKFLLRVQFKCIFLLRVHTNKAFDHELRGR